MLSFIGALLGALVGGAISFAIHQSQIKSQFQLAALDKRLEVHQEAFTLTADLLGRMADPKELRPAVDDFMNWWERNCLYLSGSTRRDVRAASIYTWWYALAINCDIDFDERQEQREGALDKLKKALDSIASGVDLPPISERELEPILDKSNRDGNRQNQDG